MIKNVRARILASIVGLLALTACGAVAEDDLDTLTSEKIIGRNDLTPVLQNGANIPAKYAPLIDAFGLMSRGCTATHVGDGIVVSAGHCFDAPDARVDDRPCKESVEWGFRKDSPSYIKSNCTRILAMEWNSTRDYAIFQVDVPPRAKVKTRYGARPPVGTPLTIFSHPAKRPLEWSMTCPLQPGSAGGWGADMLSHQCDTEGGSSGAAVIDDDTLEIVALHDGGRAPWNYATYLQATPLAEFVAPSWGASQQLELAIVDNGTTCTSVEVEGPGLAMDAKVDLEGTHTYRSGLVVTLEHDGVSKTIASRWAFGYGSGAFSLASKPAAEFTGEAAGKWTLCVTDTHTASGTPDTGVIQSFGVHN